ncbi:MAG: indolepyruvate ferredoxin oxidoreductase [Rhodobacteraceae bacterium]|nr:indolepyruvate ferredoxin oxidoreductase [Paracoccaceae bacterium]
MAPLDAQVALTDKYRVSRGAALMNGMQALVRLVIEQADADKDAGWKTGGYVSGYRGSPIGGFDMELMRAKAELDARNVVFNPGLNEDLAATAIAGTQTLGVVDDPEVEGVFSLWYGKGPGVDRSLDAIKHAALAGASPRGGLMFLLGDDPVSKSSTTAHQSETAMMHVQVPVLYPASVHEYVPLGLHGIAMSRHTGAATSLKIVTDTADSTATVALDRLRPENIVYPTLPGFELPLHNTGTLLPYVAQERRMGVRLQACMDYAYANRLNAAVFQPSGAKRLGIVAVGKGYVDAMSGLRMLDLDADRAAAAGIGMFRMRMTWPVEPKSLLEFVQGYDQILVIEEKRGIVEDALARMLVNLPGPRPLVTGKLDAQGAPLTQDWGELQPDTVAEIISREACGLGLIETKPPAPPRLTGNAPTAPRTPYFCAGCPHNRSTKLPDGSLAGGGIGCHAMSVMHDSLNTQIFTQMGGEGMHWVGRANFAGRKHMFQNIGDGTFTHSGLLAVRAAVASGVNITYKLLYNDAVAMTGGQVMEGQPLPSDMARQVLSVGVKRVAVVSDDVEATKETGDWPSANVSFHDRSEHILVQTQLREEEGTTVLLYVQTCAAEKRRRRKRGKFADPPKRVVINPLVCEGCGDCGIQSNCVAVKPLDTPFGVKRRGDQTACNKDYSCLEGFCPSFVTVEGEESDPLLGKKGIRHQPPEEALPEPTIAPSADWGALITGIGGTGVVTVAAVLGMAARLEGLHSLALDQTGLSQKNGAVQSHLQIGPLPIDDRPARVGRGKGKLLLACDMLVGAGDEAMALLDPAEGRAIANAEVEPLPMFARDPNARPDAGQLSARLTQHLGESRVMVQDVKHLATALVGDGMGANLMLVGVACQAGTLPVTPEAIERAIKLNGAAVEMNLAAFRWGRWIAHDPARAEAAAGEKKLPSWLTEDYDALVARFEAYLTDYQSARYARKFREALAKVEAAEEAAWPGRRDLSRLAARALHKSMAIKDEYEVARLHRHPDWLAQLGRDYAPDARVSTWLAPPMLAKTDPLTGHPKKKAFGPWVQKAFGTLAGMKALRGTPLDVFGRTEERKSERALVGETFKLVDLVAGKLSPATEARCREALSLPLEIKGFGHVKAANQARVKPEWDRLVADLSSIA